MSEDSAAPLAFRGSASSGAGREQAGWLAVGGRTGGLGLGLGRELTGWHAEEVCPVGAPGDRREDDHEEITAVHAKQPN